MFFVFIRPVVQTVMSAINGQKQISSQLLDTMKGFVPKIQAAWIGDDANEFASDFNRKIVPAMTELIAAIGGINLNLDKGTNLVDQADSKCKGMASQLGDVFGKIF